MTVLHLTRDVALAACASPAWADRVHGDHPGMEALLDHASAVWKSLPESEWRAAFAAHPRIGDRPSAGSREAGEQAGVAGADAAVLAELAAGNTEYEERFGMVYLVRAAGRSAPELLAILRSRLSNDPAGELAVAAEQQWEITELRLRHSLGGPEDQNGQP